MLTWTPWAVPGLAVLVIGLALALFILRARPDRYQNRILALQLACEAFAVGLVGGGVWLLRDAEVVRPVTLVAMAVVWPKLWTYYCFLGTLDTPLARPLRSPWVRHGLLLATLGGAATVALRPDWYGGEVHWWEAVRAQGMAPGTAFLAITWVWVVVWLAGLAVSVSAWKHARTEIRRQQGKAYLIAYGFRDVCFALITLAMTVVPPDHPQAHWTLVAFPLVWLVYYPLVGWGILRHQLFDVELQLKRGLRGSVVASAIAVLFFTTAYALGYFIQLDGFGLGLLLAATVAAVLRPLQRWAERIADGILPQVAPTADYLQDRRHEVYRNALEAAFFDGVVTEKEEAILLGLARSLGLADEERQEILRSVETALDRRAA